MTAHPPPRREDLDAARGLMDAFLRETGVTGSAPLRRYLWTDAFAVCTLLELHRVGAPAPNGEASYASLAVRLVDQVHHTLGQHRADDPRRGWLSGLEGPKAEAHPTAGGLRIGKPFPERGAHEPPDPTLDWERDGQYFHYLTRWMHALSRMAAEGHGERYLRWAVELAHAAYRGFLRTERGGAASHLAWKMSIDLTRPAVDTQGHHDPLDGYLTFRCLARASRMAGTDLPDLDRETATLEALAGIQGGEDWATEDPLGMGGLMVDAWRAARLKRAGEPDAEALLDRLLGAAEKGMAHVMASGLLDTYAGFRLPFRELGLSMGIHALERVDREAEESGRAPVRKRFVGLAGLPALARRVEETWLDPAHQALESWTDHRDINTVMLAASLLPGGYLGA